MVEDEIHAVFDCSAYAEFRSKPRWTPLFADQGQQDFKKFMNQENQFLLSAFINSLLNMRRKYLVLVEHDDVIVDPELP